MTGWSCPDGEELLQHTPLPNLVALLTHHVSEARQYQHLINMPQQRRSAHWRMHTSLLASVMPSQSEPNPSSSPPSLGWPCCADGSTLLLLPSAGGLPAHALSPRAERRPKGISIQVVSRPCPRPGPCWLCSGCRCQKLCRRGLNVGPKGYLAASACFSQCRANQDQTRHPAHPPLNPPAAAAAARWLAGSPCSASEG